MKPHHHERKLVDDQGQHRQQIGLADALHAGLYLPLADGIDTGDVIDALDTIQIPLMHGINPDKASASLGAWRFAHTNGVAHRSGRCEALSLYLIADAFAQVVEVRDG